ncbi:hypothetical protein Tco_0002879 [Tanacetum coccineum]
MRVSTNAPPSSSTSSSSNFEFQQMAAALEDKMTLTFRNEMNEMKNMMKALVLLLKPVSSPISPEPSSAQVNNSPPSKEPSKKTTSPYPQRMKAQETKEKNDMRFITLLSNKEKLLEAANTPLTENCSAVIMKKLLEKLGDPGCFLIPCDFTKMSKCMALADLGASINLMPLGIYQKLKSIMWSYYRVPLILVRHFLGRTGLKLTATGEELVIRDGMERIVFKPDGSQDKESIHMMDIYDNRFKDVCEPESDDSSSTSTIVEEFDSLVGEIIKQKEEVKKISDPVARRRACFSKLENFRIINQGRVIHSLKLLPVGAISHILSNNNLEDSFKMGIEDH